MQFLLNFVLIVYCGPVMNLGGLWLIPIILDKYFWTIGVTKGIITLSLHDQKHDSNPLPPTFVLPKVLSDFINNLLTTTEIQHTA